MRIRKFTSIFLAVCLTAIAFSGCKKEEEPSAPVTETTVTYPSLTDVLAETKPVSLDGEEPISEEEAVEIALKGYNALKSNSIRELIKYTNIDLYYYLATGEWATDEQLTELWKDSESGSINSFGIMENIQYMQAKIMSIEEVEDYANTIPVLETISGREIDYKITAAYRVNVFLDETYTETVTSINEDGETIVEDIYPEINNSNAPYFVVVNGNGEWRLDICVCFFKEMMNSFSSLDGDDWNALISDNVPESETTASESTAVTEDEGIPSDSTESDEEAGGDSTVNTSLASDGMASGDNVSETTSNTTVPSILETSIIN